MGGSSGLVLQPRDKHLLSELRVLRVIDREQAMLFGPFQSVARANARLLQLTRARILARTFVGTINGGRKALYYPAGQRPRLLRRPGYVGSDAFEHQLQVNRIYHAFTREPLPTGVAVLDWQGAEHPLTSEGRLIPDASVMLNTPQGPQRLHVEIDRGTESLRVIEQKASRYLDLALSAPAPFRVLLLTTTTKRMENMRKRIERVTPKLFFLTTFDQFAADGLWSPIWVRPTGTGSTSFL